MRNAWKYIDCESEVLPSQIELGGVYVERDDVGPWRASILCPCGCDQIIILCVLKGVHPSWRITRELDGTATLDPSIRMLRGCKSHFFIHSGRVKWC